VQRLQQQFLVSGAGVYFAIALTEKDAHGHRFKRMRLHHQGDLPRFRKETLVDIEIGFGKENGAARVGVIPAHYLAPHRRQLRSESGLIASGKRKRGPGGVLAPDSLVAGDDEPAGFLRTQKNAADLGSAARQREEGVHYCQADIVQHLNGVFDGKRALRRFPRYPGAIGREIGHPCF
jgi:hypothetical protein